ncbi:rhodanese-like domain-containing protein [Pseudaquabacterium rugosum]|uniref:Rhodanese-like domain-containing protein n=1 Tax=Pseudaquabacterium rugosum TaxID=2984194 RepID=A0ABU9BF53_9BURK
MPGFRPSPALSGATDLHSALSAPPAPSSRPAPTQVHSAFYRFVPLADPMASAAALRRLGEACGVLGAILLAREGLNGAVAGSPQAVQAFEAGLCAGGAALGWHAQALQGLVFKHSACQQPPFARLKVGVKPEIVALGPLHDVDAAGLPPPDEQDDSHLSPQDWRTLMQRDDVVLLDNRNHFEFRLGRFAGALDPQVASFRDFQAALSDAAPRWRADGKAVAMYCTGGIRCDKTAPWLRSLGLTVWQLDGGILNYCQSLPDADRDWQGECFVFDRRIALDSRLRETGRRPQEVYDPRRPDEAWRLERALRLDAAVAGPSAPQDDGHA